jgi:hypothetical protein
MHPTTAMAVQMEPCFINVRMSSFSLSVEPCGRPSLNARPRSQPTPLPPPEPLYGGEPH